MNGTGKSDVSVVLKKLSNKARRLGEETVEGRDAAKEKTGKQNARRTQSRKNVSEARARIREAVRRNRKERLTALLHHVYSIDMLRDSFYRLKRKAAPGADGVTWKQYEKNLEENLQSLSEKLKRGGYRPKPVKRTYIPKADGRQRPLGVTTLEDKLVQLAVVRVLEVIYEPEFRGFSYGFRPKRGPHDALNALAVGIARRKVNWVLDADIRGFFDAIEPGWLTRFIEHRIGDRRIVRLIQKWLKVGVLEEGKVWHAERGTPQGGNISPLLANVYLHYVLDTWAQEWRKKRARGDVIIVRYADDFVLGFQHREEAEAFLTDLKERFQKFGLECHAEKTRLVEFGRYAEERRKERGEGKPETFDFLGFTHVCAKSRKGGFQVKRLTMRKRMHAKLKEVKTELERRMHHPVAETGEWLGSVVEGHTQYYGVPLNHHAIDLFRSEVTRLWRRVLTRRSQKSKMTWARMARIRDRWLPPARIVRPYPDQVLRV